MRLLHLLGLVWLAWRQLCCTPVCQASAAPRPGLTLPFLHPSPPCRVDALLLLAYLLRAGRVGGVKAALSVRR